MVKALATDCGYKYMIQPDHVPIISGENPSGVAPTRSGTRSTDGQGAG